MNLCNKIVHFKSRVFDNLRLDYKKNCYSKLFSVKNLFSLIFIFAIFTILVAGTVLRIKALVFSAEFYFDEIALTNNIVDRAMIGYFSALKESQCCPPFFCILGKLVYRFFGFNQIALKSISCFFSILSLLAFLYLCLIFFKKKHTVLFTLVLFAFSENLIQYAGMFKQYSSDCLFTILILIFALQYEKIRLKMNKMHFFLLGLLAAICVLSSYTALFIIFTTFCILVIKYLCIEKKVNIVNLLCFLTPFLLVVILLIFNVFIPTKDDTYLKYWWTTKEQFYPAGIFDFRSIFTFFIYIKNEAYYIPILIFFGILIFNKDKFILSLLITPFAFAYCLGILSYYPFAPSRVSLYLFPLFFLLLSKPLDYISFKFGKKYIFNNITCILLIFIYFFFIDYNIYLNPNVKRAGYTSAKDYINMLPREEMSDNVIIFITTEQCYAFYALLFKYKIKDLNAKRYILKNDLNLVQKDDVVYFYITEINQQEENEELREWIKNNCKITYTKTGKLGTLFKCLKV